MKKKRVAETNEPETEKPQPKKAKPASPEKSTPAETETPKPESKPSDEKTTAGKKPIPGLSTHKIPVDKHIRQATSSVLATFNPNATLEEKRAKFAEIKMVGAIDNAKEASPEEARFLPLIFKQTLKEWPTGLEESLLLMNQPPPIVEEREVPKQGEPGKTEKKNVLVFGPVPKLDPDFLVPALNGYSANKMHTNQIMTVWDHHFRSYMQVIIDNL
jgi:hypothetical protein